MKISVETIVNAPIEKVWQSYTSPEAIKIWNSASDDWHTTNATVDLRVGGTFSSRMEAKDGSMGFDFAGVYTKIDEYKRIEYAFGDRTAQITFSATPNGILLNVTFDAESTHSEDQQRGGWQAILANFKKYVEANFG
jgi:uncharacterized protein YndB with AHSA1/START domain